jgi:hypothetical protein
VGCDDFNRSTRLHRTTLNPGHIPMASEASSRAWPVRLVAPDRARVGWDCGAKEAETRAIGQAPGAGSGRGRGGGPDQQVQLQSCVQDSRVSASAGVTAPSLAFSHPPRF